MSELENGQQARDFFNVNSTETSTVIDETFGSITHSDKSRDSRASSTQNSTHTQIPEKQNRRNEDEELNTDDCQGPPTCSCGFQEAQSSQASQTSQISIIKQEQGTDTDYEDAMESIGRSSEVESPSTCASARAQYYHNKLLATAQILQNKEETVRVQAASLAVAEERIAALTARTLQLNNELERKARELQALKENIENKRIQKNDVCIMADIQELDKQKHIVKTLQNNMSIIEELYRECFYETAKQEDLIEKLRKSYLDVRLLDKDKSEQINRLRGVVSDQQWSLQRCQDIALEVENLKMEITNFLNSSNNDSGVWEECTVSGVSDDLHDITTQLMRLRDLLTGDCTCGLQDENTTLKQRNYELEVQVDDLQQKVNHLESMLQNKETIDRQLQENIEQKERELVAIRERLSSLEREATERTVECETLKENIRHSQVLLDESASDACDRCLSEQHTDRRRDDVRQNRSLRDQQTEPLSNCNCRCVCPRCAGGAALCRAARRAARALTHWGGHLRELHREQEEVIRKKDIHIRFLQRLLDERRPSTSRSKSRDLARDAESSRHVAWRARDPAGTPPVTLRNCSGQHSDRGHSCTTTPARTRPPCGDYRCIKGSTRAVGVRRDAGSGGTRHCTHDCDTLVSSHEELVSRAERAGTSLAERSKRWGQTRSLH